MRVGIALGAAILIAIPSFGQDVRSLFEDPRGDSQPHLGLPLSAAAVRAAGLCADTSRSSLNGDPSRYFRLVKITNSTSREILYSGPHIDPRNCDPVGEGEWTIIFREGDSITRLFEGGGITRQSRRQSSGAVDLTLAEGPCCDDFEYEWTFVKLEPEGKDLKAEIYDQIFTTGMTLQVHPQRWFESPLPFHVEHEGYRFRYAPTLDDSTEGPLTQLGRKGNGLAEFHKGASGLAVAESRDTDGRVWWLVLIDGRYTDSRVSQTGSHVLEDRWNFGFSHPRWLGWMSSRYLKADSSLQRH